VQGRRKKQLRLPKNLFKKV